MDRSRALTLVGLAALTALGAALRLGIAGQSLFADELSTFWIVSTNDLGGVVSTVHTDAEITPAALLRGRVAGRPRRRDPRAAARPVARGRYRHHSADLPGRAPDRRPAGGSSGGGAHHAVAVHDLLLGRGARLRRDAGASAALDRRAAGRRGHAADALVGGLRGLRLRRRLHALHERVRACRPAAVAAVGASRGPPAGVAGQRGRGRGLPPVALGPAVRLRFADHRHRRLVQHRLPAQHPHQPRPLGSRAPAGAPQHLARDPAGVPGTRTSRAGCGRRAAGPRPGRPDPAPPAPAGPRGPAAGPGDRAGAGRARRGGPAEHGGPEPVRGALPRGLVAGVRAVARGAAGRSAAALAPRGGGPGSRRLRDRRRPAAATRRPAPRVSARRWDTSPAAPRPAT